LRDYLEPLRFIWSLEVKLKQRRLITMEYRSYRLIFLTLCLAIVFQSVNCGVYPKELPRCKSGDNECLPRVIQEVLRKTKNGNAALNLPRFEPLHIPKMDIIQGGNSQIAIQLHLRDLDFHGLSTAIVNKTIGFGKNPRTSKFEVHARIPRLQLIAKYKIDGRVLILPITGNGPSNLTLDNVDVKIKFAPIVSERNGKTYLQVNMNKVKLTLETSRLYFFLDNLFNGNKALSDNMNLFLNENWQIIFQELKPAVREALIKILTSIINSVFANLPYEDIFSDTDNSR